MLPTEVPVARTPAIAGFERALDAEKRLAASSSDRSPDDSKDDLAGDSTTRSAHDSDDAGLDGARWLHDERGRIASIRDDEGTLLALGYTGSGQLRDVTHADGARTVLHYDRKGRSLALRDARGNTSWRVRDDFGQLVWTHDPDAGATAFEYDAAGNRTRRITAEGETIELDYDRANRRVRRASSSDEILSTYDPTTGRLASTRNAATTETFRYDDEGDLVEHVREIDGHRFVTRHAYDAFGRIARKVLPDGTALRHHYHESGPERGRLRAVTREVLFGLRQETVVAEIDQDARDGRSGFLSHNGLRTTMTHDADGRLTSLSIDEALRLRYR